MFRASREIRDHPGEVAGQDKVYICVLHQRVEPLQELEFEHRESDAVGITGEIGQGPDCVVVLPPGLDDYHEFLDSLLGYYGLGVLRRPADYIGERPAGLKLDLLGVGP